MSTNVDWAVLTRLKTVIEAVEPCPDVVQIVPKGAEKFRPTEGSEFWVNLSPQNNSVVIETSDAFINTTIVRIDIGVESTGCLSDVVKLITEASSSITQTVIYSTLDGYARRTPAYSIEGYSGGDENNSIYWYTMTLMVEHQVEN